MRMQAVFPQIVLLLIRGGEATPRSNANTTVGGGCDELAKANSHRPRREHAALLGALALLGVVLFGLGRWVLT